MPGYERVPLDDPEIETETESVCSQGAAASSSAEAERCNLQMKDNLDDQYVALPPPYGDNNDLPTYEEVERIKQDEETRDNESSPYSSLLNGAMTASLFNSELEVGSDSTFLLTFLISLMFSWVGFMLTFCVSNSLAGRYGALSGFGLSLIKWTVLMSHSEYATSTNVQTTYWFNAWVSWLLIMSGGTIFIRGIYLYVRAKQRVQTGHALNSDSEAASNRPLSLFYFY